MKIKSTLLTIVFLIITNLSFSQIVNHVKWTYTVKPISDNEVVLTFNAKIEDKWHLYGLNDELNPIILNLDKSDNYAVKGKFNQLGKPHKAFDELMGATREEYSKTASFEQTITILSKTDFKITGNLDYQACLDDGMCVMENPKFEFSIKGAKNIGKIEKAETETKTEVKAEIKDTTNIKKNETLLTVTNNDTSEIAKKKDRYNQTIQLNVKKTEKSESNSDLMTLFWLAFIGGLAAIFTPCVFPMIPMTVSFFMHDGQSKAKARFEALVYSISIIAIYTIIGTLVAITFGANFANWLSTHWIPNVAFFIIFLIFAASFFGMFEITLPSWMVNKADKQADKGGVLGAFFMAFTLVLVSFSCTGPIVGGILVASAGGEILMPIIGMLGFSLAFALPFGLFAFFPSLLQGMPKSGGWLNSVKVVLGFIEIALGLKFLSIADQTYHWGILDREVYLAIWIVIFALLGIYLLGKIKFAHDSDLKHVGVPRLFLVIVTFSFVIYMIPGMFGAPLKMLSGYLPPQQSIDFDLERLGRESAANTIEKLGVDSKLCFKAKYSEFLHLPHGLHGYYTYKQALDCAKQQNKPIFVDFTGHGCVNCREMEASVWKNPAVLKRLQDNFIIFSVYVDDKTELPENEWVLSRVDGELKKTLGKINADFQIYNFNENSQPVYAILNHEGEVMNGTRSYNKDIDAFVQFLDEGSNKFNAN